MKNLFLFSSLIIFVVFASCVQNTKNETIESNKGQFISFTDLHFTPFFDTTLIKSLDNQSFTKWDSIFRTSSQKGFGTYGNEANYFLFTTALKHMKNRIENPELIVMCGDFICHNFEEKYIYTTKKKDFETIHKFTEKTVRFVTQKISQTFPKAQVIISLGNNDSYCGDYQIEPGGDFLRMAGNLWDPLINKKENTDFKITFNANGYYSVTSSVNTNHKFIVLNTIQFSPKYKSSEYDQFCDCEPMNYDSLVNVQLTWFENELKTYSSDGNKVWVVTHIPPGIDIYKTMEESGNCTDKVAGYWKSNYTERFKQILSGNTNAVKAIFVGHTHMDDFKIILNGDKPQGLVHITPSISPIFGNNPGYEIIEYDKNSGTLLNYKTYYVDLVAENQQWQYSYDFNKTYGTDSITPTILNKVYHNFLTDSTVRKTYFENYPVRSKGGDFIDDKNWACYKCGMVSLMDSNYVECCK